MAPTRPALKRARRTHAERSLATQLELIAATIRVIEQKGLEAASTFEIAKEAGVTPGAIQHHFESKKALILSAATELVHADDRHGSLIVWPPPETPLQTRAREAVRTAWHVLYSQPRYLAMWSIFMSCRTDPELLAHLTAEREKLRVRTFQNFMTAFPELAKVRDREGFASVIFSSLRGMGMLEMFQPPAKSSEEQLSQLAKLIAQKCEAAMSSHASKIPRVARK